MRDRLEQLAGEPHALLSVQSTVQLRLNGEMCSGFEAGSHLRLIDGCITQLKAQGPSRTCNESQKEEEDSHGTSPTALHP